MLRRDIDFGEGIIKMRKPTKPCHICGTNDWWQRSDGAWLCNQCHPNPNPGSSPENPAGEKYSPEVLALRDRVILGNKKLNDAWKQICLIDGESQEWKDLFEQWHQANEKLSVLCSNLRGLGYEDCLYLDEEGKKTRKCLSQGDDIGCRVCPSTRKYWEEEFEEL